MTKSECSTSQQQTRFQNGKSMSRQYNNSNSNKNNNNSLTASQSGSSHNNNHHEGTVNGTRNDYYNYHNYTNYYNYHITNHPRSALTETTNVTHLNPRQVERIRSVLQQNVEIHGRENFPTLKIPLHKLIVHVKRKISQYDLYVKHVKLNGGAASYVLATADNFAYSDLDLIFPISLKTEQDFDKVRSAVFDTLLELMPESTNKEMISPETLKDIYIQKMIRVINNDQDRWSLISFHNYYGRCIEFKFVDNMRRQFEFSVDSFQITLDKLLDNPKEHRPLIQAESMYGDFFQALSHLNRRFIDTRNPEEIRGGGLLKYCHLLTRGYRATYNCREMEKYMCSRFFIDFSDISAQEAKLCSYLENHFGNELQKYDYLQVLYRVIKESTICLMGHERRQTLSMVENLRNNLQHMAIYAEQNAHLCYAAAAAAAGAGNGTVYYGTADQINAMCGGGVTATPPFAYYISCQMSPMTAAAAAMLPAADSADGSPSLSPAPSDLLGTRTEPADGASEELVSIQLSESVVSIDSAIDASNNFAQDQQNQEQDQHYGYSIMPRQTLLYLPPNSTTFEYVGVC